MKTPGGTTLQIPESQITGGTLGGLLSFRSQSLDSAQNALGRVAIALTQTFNNQHELGQDLTGALGGAFFSVSAPTAYGNSLNAGSGVLSASFSATAASDLTTSDYSLSYDGTNYTLTRLADNKTWTGATLTTMVDSGGNVAAEGFNLAMAGTPAAGDSFKIEPTRTGASSIGVAVTDARNIAAAAPFSTAAGLNNSGTATISAGAVINTSSLPLAAGVTFTYNAVAKTLTTPAGAAPWGGLSIAYDPATQSGVTLTVNGLSFTVSGTPANGDTFALSANTAGVSDNRNAVALAALQTAKTMIGSATGNTASYQDAYAQMVSEIGVKTNQANSLSQAQQTLADSAVSAQQSVSGVNLDEEAANLIKYQQAYQASAKAKSIFLLPVSLAVRLYHVSSSSSVITSSRDNKGNRCSTIPRALTGAAPIRCVGESGVMSSRFCSSSCFSSRIRTSYSASEISGLSST